MKTNRNQDDDAGVTFASLTPDAPRQRGPAPQPDSLRQQLARGEARWLKVALPVPLARAVHVAAAARDTTPSEVIAQLVRDHLQD